MNCLICGTDDGLAILCGTHWSEYVRWQRAVDQNQPRHPVTGRFLAFNCETDCQQHCAGLCGNM